MIDAEQVRQAARGVLADPDYADLRPSAGRRVLAELRAWFAERLADLLGSAGAGALGQVLVVVVPMLLVVLAVVVLLRLRRGGAVPAVAGYELGLDRAALLARAEAAGAVGDLATAVRARYAVLVHDLRAREVLGGEPGTTVGEVDRAVARDLPAAADVIAAAGRVLAGVVYGAATPTPHDVEVVAAAVRAAEPTAARVGTT